MSKKNIFFYFGTFCIIISFIFLARNLLEDKRVNVNTKRIMESMKDDMGQISKKDDSYIENPKKDMPIKEIDGYEYIGYLKFENLNIDLPVMSSWSYKKIKIAPARYRGSIYENNMIILGHNYRAHFGCLFSLDVGDSIVFVDMDENQFKYRVSKIEKIDGESVDELLSGDWDLSLFTCTLSGVSRLLLRCERI